MLELSGVLAVTVEGIPLRVTAAGREIRVETDRPLALLRRGGWRTLRAAGPVLRRLGLSVRVIHRGRAVWRMGAR